MKITNSFKKAKVERHVYFAQSHMTVYDSSIIPTIMYTAPARIILVFWLNISHIVIAK